MAIDRSKLPPELAKLLTDLEASGARVEVITDDAEAQRAFNEAVTGKTSAPSSPALPDLDQLLDEITRAALAPVKSLHEHLCPRVKRLEGEAKATAESAARFRVEINQRYIDVIDNIQARVAALSEQVSSLAEAHRKQVSLLHRRVTKRKTAIAKVASKTRTKIES